MGDPNDIYLQCFVATPLAPHLTASNAMSVDLVHLRAANDPDL